MCFPLKNVWVNTCAFRADWIPLKWLSSLLSTNKGSSWRLMPCFFLFLLVLLISYMSNANLQWPGYYSARLHVLRLPTSPCFSEWPGHLCACKGTELWNSNQISTVLSGNVSIPHVYMRLMWVIGADNSTVLYVNRRKDDLGRSPVHEWHMIRQLYWLKWKHICSIRLEKTWLEPVRCIRLVGFSNPTYPYHHH